MMRFKYSFTLWFEENGPVIFALPAAIALSVVADEYNSFEGGLYYFINIVVFVFGFFIGRVTCWTISEWMRKRTLWLREWEDEYHESIFPIRYDNSKIEKPIEESNGEGKIDSEEKWKAIHTSFRFGKLPIEKYLFLLVTLSLLAIERSQFKENEIAYSARVLLDSFAFYIAFMYISKPVFGFTKYNIAMLTDRFDHYTFGSFEHKFYFFKVLIKNSILYGYTAYYSHQLFLSFK